MTRAELRTLLARHGLHLSRELGQNFLADAGRAGTLAEAAGVRAGDVVIEVGTGLGALTRALASRAARVITLEIDSGLVRALRAEALLPSNVELRHVDALDADWGELLASAGGAPVRVVANLPYASATPVLRRMLDLREQLVDWSVMVQREVGARLMAGPGGRDYGSFAVLHALTVRVETLADLPGDAFFPPPQVHSRFVRCTPLRPDKLEGLALSALERVARAAFGTRRKTIANALRAGSAPGDAAAQSAALRACAIDPRARAESLAPERFVALARELAAPPAARGG